MKYYLLPVLCIFCLAITVNSQENEPCTAIFSGQINVRSGPGTNYPVQMQLSSGVIPAISGQTTGNDGFTWWQLDGENYWVREDIINTSENCDEIPEVENIPFAPVTYNDQWTQIIHDFDGTEMVLVPPGCLQMGYIMEGEQPDYWNGNEFVPIGDGGIQCFEDAFWIGRYEITQGQYPGCMRGWCGDDMPRIGLSWQQANDFCESQGMRLPTEAEYEYAARGPDGLWYAWGNHFNPDNLVYGLPDSAGPSPVGSKENDMSWVGAYDMTGNVAEWVSSWLIPYPYNADDGREGDDIYPMRATRGGSYTADAIASRLYNRSGLSDTEPDVRTGVRCAMNYTNNMTESDTTP